MPDESFDRVRSEAFAGRMVEALNGAAITLMASIGHQVGLFDVMAERPAATSHQLAEAAGLDERYVREWLGAVATGRVVDFDPTAQTYTLPPEHAAWLTRAAGVDNLAFQARYIPMLAQVEAPIIECFRHGGGVSYAAYPQFQQLMAEDSGNVHDAALLDVILPLAPGLPERLRAGIDVADIGCGRGHAINLMAGAFPDSRFVGYDFSAEGIAAAQDEAQRLDLPNARFEARDVSDLNLHERFDLVTAFDAIHDQAQPARVLAGIARALRPDGVFLMVDCGASSNLDENMDFPLAPLMYAVSCMHCMTVSLALDGTGLGAMWGEQQARAMLADAGFARIAVEQVEGDRYNKYYVAGKG